MYNEKDLTVQTKVEFETGRGLGVTPRIAVGP